MVKTLMGLGITAFVVISFIVIILFPIAVIWSLNTLFPVLNIPVTLDTWLATMVLGTVFRSTIQVKKG